MNSSTASSYDMATETGSRKDSHAELAFLSQNDHIDPRFYYEPMLAAHPATNEEWPVALGNKTLRYPIWISSMTGGTPKTNAINLRLAKAAAKYGLGMGVGSARIALEDPRHAKGFDLRPVLGEGNPFYLNFGIAQIEKMLHANTLSQIADLVASLRADGVIIHVNPLQEWMQPEGDRILQPPVVTIEQFLEKTKLPLIVKEVGQGFGPKSMQRLLQLPLVALEFAANGGTNFSKLELLRNEAKSGFMMPFVHVGQSAEEMVDLSNQLMAGAGGSASYPTLIISGGIRTFLDGYYLIQKASAPAIYGQASEMLRHAQESEEALDAYLQYQIEGLLLARSYLTIKDKK